MKMIIKCFFKITTCFMSIVLAVATIVSVCFGISGYKMYKEAVQNTTISEMVKSIQDDENFVEYNELPEIYIDAVISVEDKRFFEHNGVDYLAICRALWNDIRAFSFVEGGSTITQQIMKNEYFTQEKRLERKVAEVFAAWDLEKECSKEEIFELYVNTIYFGSGYYGIYDAAQGYYGKTPMELTDYEAVMLAGLPNAPSAYSIDVNPQLAKQRMKQVLESMVDCEVISEEKANEIFLSE